jgi:hypothetical protein
MSKFKARLAATGTGLFLVLSGVLSLGMPAASSAQPIPTASVTVCQVTGSASAPSFLEVTVSVDQLAAYLNQFPGSFVGSCPAPSGNEPGSNPPVSGVVTVCRVAGSARAPVLSEVLVSVDQVTAFLNANPNSFVGACPNTAGGGNAGRPTGNSGPLSAVVTVCRVTGSANAPQVAQITLTVDRVAAFLNANPGSFVGTCPGDDARVANGPGRVLGIPAGAALSVCRVTAGAGALRFAQLNVAIDRLAAFLNQNPGSFVGLCPGSGDPNGTIGNEPLGYVTICRVTGTADNPLAPVTIRLQQLEAYLTQPGTVVPAPASGCPRAQSPGGDGVPPSSTSPGQTSTVVVHTTPNTVVTAKGAGVEESTRSNKKGKAKVKVRPKRPGIVTVRGGGGRVITRIGVVPRVKSGGFLTG